MKAFFGGLVLILSAILVGSFAGFKVASKHIEAAITETSVMSGPWSTAEYYGSTNATPAQRAMVAIFGLFALNKSETIYYTARHDSHGDLLDASCTYVVKGSPIDTRWWSITAYGDDHFLIDNPDNRYSFNMANLVTDVRGNFDIHVSKTDQGENWLPLAATQKPKENFSLTMRLYNPSEKIYNNLERGLKYKILKQDCASE